MLIQIKNKDTLIVGNFKFKCCIGKNGFSHKKKEGDMTTPRGIYKLGPLYYRSDRVKKPKTNLLKKKIKINMGWCNDPKSKFYNKEIDIKKNIRCEKIFRKDSKYNYLIFIKYNYNKRIPGKGSAIFLHLTQNYKPTAGCIAIQKKDFLIILKLINKKTKIKIH